MSNIDNLLNVSLDNIDDLPSTSAWPIGAHQAKVTMELNVKKADNPSIIVRATLLATEEQADPEATPSKPGDQYTWFYSLLKKDKSVNEYAQQQLKTYFGVPATEAGLLDGGASLGTLVEAYKDGVEMLLTTGHREYQGETQMTIKSTAIV